MSTERHPIMFNPSEPNTKREITLTYTTDESGELEIDISSEGFETDPRYVPLFILATLETFKEGKPISE